MNPMAGRTFDIMVKNAATFFTYTKALGKDSDFNISFNSPRNFISFKIVAHMFIDLTVFIYQYS